MRVIDQKYILSRLSILMLAFFLLPGMINSQERFYASCDSDQIEEGDIFEIRYTLENAEGKDFIPPAFNQFDLVSGPSRSSEMSIINGVSKSNMSFIYSIKAGKPGVYTIAPAQISTGKKRLKSNHMTIKVVKASRKNFSNISKSENFFVTAEISDKSAYPGQQLILKYKLFTSVEIAGVRAEYEPDFIDFKAEPVNIDFPVKAITINKKLYSVHTIKTTVLYPLKTGQLIIPSGKFMIEVPARNARSIFFYNTVPHHLSTENIKIEVKSLPHDKPEEFSGQVGDFKIEARISSGVQRTDEAFSLIVDIESDAFENSVTAPDFRENFPDLEIYDAKLLSNSNSFRSGRVISSKSFEYLVVPERAGKQIISIPFTYFDPEKEQYKTIKTEPIEIEVKKGKGISKENASDPSSIKPSKTDLHLKRMKKPFFGSFLYWGIIGFLLISLTGLYLFRIAILKNKGVDPSIIKLKRADKEAMKRMKMAKALMDSGDEKLFFREIYDVLTKFASDKLQLPQSEINSKNLLLKLSQAGISDANANAFISQLKKCEAAIYAGIIKPDLNEFFESTKSIISGLQKEFKSI